MHYKSHIALVVLLVVTMVGCSDQLVSTPDASPAEAATQFEGITPDQIQALKTEVPYSKKGLDASMTIHDHVDYYDDRDDFNQAVPSFWNMAHEDFEGSLAPAFGFGTCTDPVYWVTGGNGCWPERRELRKRFSAEAVGPSGNEMVAIDPNALGLGTTTMAANFFVDDMEINMTGGGTYAVGFDLIDFFGGQAWDLYITVSGGPNVLVSGAGGGFHGFVSPDYPITKIKFVGVVGTSGELVDDLAYQY